MTLLDGKKLSLKIQDRLKEETKELKIKEITPGLAVLLVGDDPASHVYVNMKEKACNKVGIYSAVHKMPIDSAQKSIIDTIKMLNNNPNIHGILVQLPLPLGIDTNKVLESIDPKKDVDGFHPYNVGRLVLGLDSYSPCTPLGVMKLLKEYDIELKGLDICVVGASNIVGKPMQALLLNAFATVDICHIHTKNLKEHTKRADVVIVGVGVVNLIKEDMIKENAVVVDIGINKLESGKLVGDVDFMNVSKKTSFITPVPGGVGPMTIAMLLENTVKAASLVVKEK